MRHTSGMNQRRRQKAGEAKRMVAGKKSKEQVLCEIGGRFCIEFIPFEQVDQATQEALKREASYL